MQKRLLFLFTGIALAPVLQAQEWQRARTPDGRPDLQGTWTNASITTLERNARYDKLVLTNDEVSRLTREHPQNVRLATDDNLVAGELLDGTDLPRGRGYNAFWIDPGTEFGMINGEVRTSWIVDPPDGRIPYSESGRARIAAAREKRVESAGPEARPLAERCLSTNNRVGPPMINGLYNNNYEFVQTPDYVVFRTEMIIHARIVPINSEHTMGSIAPAFGESVGYWEGDTLVVETTNFNSQQEEASVPLSHDGRVEERFTRVSEQQIDYEFIIDDPVYYSQPWRGEARFLKTEDKVYEFACHEGNYALSAILAGARRQQVDDELGRSDEE